MFGGWALPRPVLELEDSPRPLNSETSGPPGVRWGQQMGAALVLGNMRPKGREGREEKGGRGRRGEVDVPSNVGSG